MIAKPPKHTATFRFYEELNDFLPVEKRKKVFTYEFPNTPSIKDAIEAIGVPHTEVDLILVDQQSVDFNYRLHDRDRVAVYPVFENLDISSINKLRKKPLRKPKFILDVHLGKLARYLRLLGIDTFYQNNLNDKAIIKRALSEKRIILTRDIGLLKNKAITHGYWLRNTSPEKQLGEIVEKFDLRKQLKPFKRCLECNGLIKRIPKKIVVDRLPPKTLEYFTRFYQCKSCHRLYWEGSHYDKLLAFIESVF